jgi:NitT/TauT family transport system substrate-binding protein
VVESSEQFSLRPYRPSVCGDSEKGHAKNPFVIPDFRGFVFRPEARIHSGLVGLRGLDTVLLHEQVWSAEEMGGQVWHSLKVQRFDYAPSLDAFVARNIDACTMTNMEALDLPAASGVPTTAILVGDYSNGNDALLVRNGISIRDLASKKMLLVQKTVSEYLFDRAMTINGLRGQIKQVRLINTSDSDIAAAFLSDSSVSAVVTWKPMVSQIVKQKGIASLFNSSQIPGEILDLTVVRTDVLNRADGAGRKFAQALTGAWYEMLAQMKAPGGDKVLASIAEGSEDTLASYKEQLSTTKMFYTPQSAVDFTASADLKQKMALVRRFCFEHGLLGEKTQSVDDVAIRYPDGSVQGKPDRVRLQFDANYMRLAAQGKL